MQDTIRPTSDWQIENDIIVPVPVEEHVTSTTVTKTGQAVQKRDLRPVVKAHHEVPALLAYPYVTQVSVTKEENTAPEGGVTAADSIGADSLLLQTQVPGEIKEGIILIDPAGEYKTKEMHLSQMHWSPMSWIYLVMIVLFCVAAMKFKGNSRYMKALMSDLTNTRVRPNTFDVTVRETSLLVILNIVWVGCVGVLLWNLIHLTTPHTPFGSFSLPDRPWLGIAVCAGVTGGYIGMMMLAYWIVGNVFSDSKQTRLWVKGAAAANGLETFLLFPIALLALGYPAWNRILLIMAAVVLIFGKIVFLYKGFRIFFVQISSWLLFLYYLCSLEIVPLILTYFAALWACSKWM